MWSMYAANEGALSSGMSPSQRSMYVSVCLWMWANVSARVCMPRISLPVLSVRAWAMLWKRQLPSAGMATLVRPSGTWRLATHCFFWGCSLGLFASSGSGVSTVMVPLLVPACVPRGCGGGMPLHGGCVVDVPAAGMFGFAGWWCELGPELVDLVVDGGEDGVEVEVSCRCGGEPPRGDLAPDLFPGDVGVGECWLAADELFDCVLVPGAGCLVKLPCPGFLGAGFSGDPAPSPPGPICGLCQGVVGCSRLLCLLVAISPTPP